MSQSLFPRYTVSSDECHPRHDVEIPKITPFGSPLPDMRSINSPPPQARGRASRLRMCTRDLFTLPTPGCNHRHLSRRPDGLVVRIGRVLGLPSVSDSLQELRLYYTIVTAHPWIPWIVQGTHHILYATKKAATGGRHTAGSADGDGF